MRTKIGNVFIVLGLLLVLAGIGLGGFNLWTENQAGADSASALDALTHQLETPAQAPEQPQAPTGPAAGEDDPAQTPEFGDAPTLEQLLGVPGRMRDPYREMPTTEIDGVAYIGYLEIPSLDLKLPIINETTNAYLQKAPCRFYGSAYLENMVIGAHNYNSHFGRLGYLSYGDIVIFRDMEGNVFTYEVADIETLKAYQGEYLCSGEWDLSLFTCTLGGEQRITIRCQEI